MPFKQFTDVYVIGGNEQTPDALHLLKSNIDIAVASGTIESLFEEWTIRRVASTGLERVVPSAIYLPAEKPESTFTPCKHRVHRPRSSLSIPG